MNNRLEHYLEFLAGHCALSTVRRVRTILTDFMHWVEQHGVREWFEVTPDHIREWTAQKTRTVKPRTAFTYKQELHHFLEWMYRNEYLLVSPWDEAMEGRPPAYAMRRVPTTHEARTLLESVGTHGMHGVRDRAILELAYGSGLRRKELHPLNLPDIRDDTLRVRGKGDRVRMVPLGRQAKRWLLRYVAVERMHWVQFFEGHQPALFLTRYGSRLGLDSYSLILRRHGLNRLSTLHGLRHGCATHMLRNGADIRTLQKLLGHRKLSSTQIYTHVDRTDLRDLLDRFHPRG